MRRQAVYHGRHIWLMAAGAGVLLAMLGTGSRTHGAAPTEASNIEIVHHQYRPTAVTVRVGGTVTWVNHDDDVHTVTSSTEAFTSAGIDTDETFSYTFTKPGTYQYFCRLHPLMTATIVVK